MIAENTNIYNTNNNSGLLASVKGLIKASGDGKEFLKIFSSEGSSYRKHTPPMSFLKPWTPAERDRLPALDLLSQLGIRRGDV